MKCEYCNKELGSDANFCDSCGRAVDKIAELYRVGDSSLRDPGNERFGAFKKTKLMNWILLGLWMLGSVSNLARLDFSGQIVWIFLSVTFVLISVPLLTVMILSDSDSRILGVPLFLLESRRSLFRKIAISLNSILLLFGASVMVMGVINGQYISLLSAVIFVLPSAINIRALIKVK